MLALFVSGQQVGGVFERIEIGSDRFVCVKPSGETLDVMFTSVPGAAIGEGVAPVPMAEREALMRQIDADADYIYGAVQGNRGIEYTMAEAEATAYKAAGYTGTVPSSVGSWASAKGQTATWAADDILATAVAWRGAMAQIRAQRLARKEAAKTAPALAPVAAQWTGFVAGIKTALGVA